MYKWLYVRQLVNKHTSTMCNNRLFVFSKQQATTVLSSSSVYPASPYGLPSIGMLCRAEDAHKQPNATGLCCMGGGGAGDGCGALPPVQQGRGIVEERVDALAPLAVAAQAVAVQAVDVFEQRIGGAVGAGAVGREKCIRRLAASLVQGAGAVGFAGKEEGELGTS